MEYRVSLGELLSPSLYLRIICLDWKCFRASRSYVMEREWGERRLTISHMAVPAVGWSPGGGLEREYMHTYTHTHTHTHTHTRPHTHTHTHTHAHTRCVHPQPSPIGKSLSAVVSKWSICKCLSQEGDIWPKDLGFQDQPIISGVHGASFRSSVLTLLRRWRKCITVVSGKFNRVKIRGQKARHFSKTEVGNGLKESKACQK